MKTPKILLVAAAAALAFAGVAPAQTEIYLSGAPATRAIWNQAIYNTLVAQSGVGATITKYWSGGTSGPSGSGYDTANQIVLTGGKIGGTAVTIYGSWTGSTGGNQSVANTPPETITALKVGFLKLSLLTTPGGGYVYDSTPTDANSNFQYPHANLSDTLQSTLPFTGTTTVTTPKTSYVTLTEAPTASPAVTGYEWLTNKGGGTRGLTNITTDLARILFTNPGIPLALFTGSASDTGVTVYPVGRDIASGARYILLAETGIGTKNNTSLIQYTPTVTAGAITDIVDNPSAGGTINLITYGTGNGGYPSFSNVETDLAATSSDSVGYIVTYVTDSDAEGTAKKAGAQELTWNGVPYSVSAIQQGQYTYWSYLHVYYKQHGKLITINHPLSKTFADDLAADLATDTTYDVNTAAILTSSLVVLRQQDGGLVTPNY